MPDFAKKEGRRIRGIEPMQGVEPFIMPTRNGASNWIRDTIQTELIDEYINKKNSRSHKATCQDSVTSAEDSKQPGANRSGTGTGQP
jgi:hypothetical protein